MAQITDIYMSEVKVAFAAIEKTKVETKELIHKFRDNVDKMTEAELTLFNAFQDEYFNRLFHPKQYGLMVPNTYMALKLRYDGFACDLKYGTGTAEDMEQYEWDDAVNELAIEERKGFILGCKQYIEAVEKLRGDFLEKYDALQASKVAIAIEAPAQPKTKAKAVKQQPVSIFSRIKNTIKSVCNTIKDTVCDVVDTIKTKITNTIAAVTARVAALMA